MIRIDVARLSRTLIQLNIATRVHHDAADALWLDLMSTGTGKQGYIAHLVKVYGFEAPLEAAYRYTPGLAPLIDLRGRMRTGLLAQDLMRLGVSASQIAQLPQRFMTLNNAAEALGWMYVVERATLLHGGVRRYLAPRIADLTFASSYLLAYDDVASQRWGELSDALDAVAPSPSAMAQVVRAANQGFRALREWFDEREPLRSAAT